MFDCIRCPISAIGQPRLKVIMHTKANVLNLIDIKLAILVMAIVKFQQKLHFGAGKTIFFNLNAGP